MTTYPYLQYEQPGGVFYACVLRADLIIRRLDIRRRSQDRLDGIQRDENAVRVREISNFLREPSAILPTPIIVSAYEDVVSISDMWMEIADTPDCIGHILDGQHRVLGLRSLNDSELSRINLLVVFVFEIDPFAQATIFTTINSNQKQVSKSLIYDLFELDPKRSTQRTAHEIAKSLNDDPESPFFRRVKLLGKKVEETETLSQAAFVDRLLDSFRETESVLKTFYDRDEDWAIRKVVGNVFAALLEAQAASQNEYPKDYFLKTTGYGGVMKSVNTLSKRLISGKSLSQDAYQRYFEKFLEAHPKPPEGTGNSAMLTIRDWILEV